MSIPQDILAEAEAVGAEMDAEMDQALLESVPQGQFSAQALNAVVAELNNILPLFGAPLYPEFTEDQVAFPVEFVQQLIMLAGAADQAGVELAMDLDVVETDRDLAMLAGIIADLAANEAFLAFIQAPVEETVVEETVVEEPPPEEVVEEDIFIDRM